jgi:thiamine monophosphate synthase
MHNILKENLILLKLENKDNCLFVTLNKTIDSDILLDNIAKQILENPSIIILDGQAIGDNCFLTLARKIQNLCAEFDSIVIIKNRVDITLLAEADGIVFDSTGIDVNEAKHLLHENILIGYEQITSEKLFETDFYIQGKLLITKHKTITVTELV